MHTKDELMLPDPLSILFLTCMETEKCRTRFSENVLVHGDCRLSADK